MRRLISAYDHSFAEAFTFQLTRRSEIAKSDPLLGEVFFLGGEFINALECNRLREVATGRRTEVAGMTREKLP